MYTSSLSLPPSEDGNRSRKLRSKEKRFSANENRNASASSKSNSSNIKPTSPTSRTLLANRASSDNRVTTRPEACHRIRPTAITTPHHVALILLPTVPDRRRGYERHHGRRHYLHQAAQTHQCPPTPTRWLAIHPRRYGSTTAMCPASSWSSQSQSTRTMLRRRRLSASHQWCIFGKRRKSTCNYRRPSKRQPSRRKSHVSAATSSRDFSVRRVCTRQRTMDPPRRLMQLRCAEEV